MDPVARTTDTDDELELSVVVAARNAATTLPAQLEALVAQAAPASWELVVADNGSTDGTHDLVRRAAESAPWVRLVDASARRGPAHARNVGAQAARGRALAFCDADDVVGPEWVVAMRDALAEHEFVTGPLEFATLNPAWLADSRGSTGANEAALFEGTFRFASSRNFGIRRDLFESLAGFEEDRTVGEDIDLSRRLDAQGIELWFARGALVHYRYRPTLRANFAQARSYGAARTELLEALRATGDFKPDRGADLRRWAWLVRHLPDTRHLDGRARWVWVAGQRIGSLQGSLSVRRLYF